MHRSRIHDHWHYIFNNHDLNHFFFAITLRWFGLTLMDVFVPAYLYMQGYPLRSVFLFFSIFSLSHALTVFLAGDLVTKWGAKHLITLTIPLWLVYFTVLANPASLSGLFLWLAVLGGLANGLFWVAYHLFFSIKASKKTRGRKIGTLVFISGLFLMIAPVIGGYLLDNHGPTALLTLMAFFLIASVIPLRGVDRVKIKKTWKTKDILSVIHHREGLAYLARGFPGMATGILWPLALFLIFKGYLALGIVTFLTSFISLVANLFGGFLVDKWGERRVLKLTSSGESFLWVARLFATVPIAAIIIDALDKTVMRIFSLSFDARSYAKSKNPKHILFREAFINIGAAIGLGLLTILPSFSFGYTLAAIGSLWVMLL